jgi:hypothetical protein
MRLSPGSMLRTSLLTPGERLRLLALFATVQRAKPAQLVGRSVDEWLAPYPRRVRQFADMLIRVSSYTDAPDVFDAGGSSAGGVASKRSEGCATSIGAEPITGRGTDSRERPGRGRADGGRSRRALRSRGVALSRRKVARES